jgi:hypothetical protein
MIAAPIPDDAFHRIYTRQSPIVDRFPGTTPSPRPDVDLPVSKVITRLSQPLTQSAAPTVAEAKAYALARLGQTQYTCLDQIAEHESHWRVDARNRYSGAYGIGQALPASKMAPYGKDYLTNPITQVRWMIGYVSKYGSACGAWSFWQNHHWY